LLSRPRYLTTASAIATAIVAAPILTTAALATDEVLVRSGDTLTAISRRHDVPIERLVEINDLADPNRIFVGQTLRLEPAPAAAAPKPPAPAPATPAPAAPAARVHTVRVGEHLTGISRRYGVTIAAIAKANRVADPGRIFAGQQLTIPGTAAAPAPAAAAKPAAPAMPSTMAALVAQRDDVRRVIVEEANRFGVPPALALAVAWQESGWQQKVVSSAGAVGVMQLLPTTGEWVGEAMLGSAVEIHDVQANVRAGVRLLRHYLDRYDGNRDLVLAAYYQGQTAADRHGVYRVSRPYIASIKLLEAFFGR
jgi:soluble lytic murein transglycosylase-like protein